MIEIPEGRMNPAQLEFLRDESPYSLMCGGVGSGKSVALQAKIIQLKGINGTVPGLVMAETLGELMTNVIDPLIEMLGETLPDHLVPDLVFDPKGRRYMRFPDGCRVHLRSAQSIHSYAGINVGWLCGDEPWLWSRNAYLKAIERVRIKASRRLQRAFTSTPAMNYLADEFNTNKRFRNTIHCGTAENAHNLAPGYIEGLLASYSMRMARAMIYGEWTVLEGAVYEAFDPLAAGLWIIYYDGKDHLQNKTCLAIDPGQRRSSILWIHEVDDTEWVVFDELMSDNMSDESVVQAINDRGWPVDEIWCDPAADQVQSAFSLDTLDMLKQIKMRKRVGFRGGIKYIVGPFRSIPYGVDKTRMLLGDPDNKRPIRVRFARSLLEYERNRDRGIIKDLSRYRYPEVKDNQPLTDHPLKDGKTDHSCDAFRYWSVGMWLTSPLRHIDPKLAKIASRGFKQAA